MDSPTPTSPHTIGTVVPLMGGKSHLEMFHLTLCFERNSTVGRKIDVENMTRINRGLEIIRDRFGSNSRVHKYPAPARSGDEILYGDA
jgi:hypothetical protein